MIVQHMPDGFTEMFARRLDELCSLRVKEAQSGDVLQAGRVLVCPGSRHMKVKRLTMGDIVVLSDEPRVNGHRPSVDVLFQSVAEEFGPQAIAVLMTGMGDDGAEGLGAVKKAGGMTIAQSEESCVVFGMPKAAHRTWLCHAGGGAGRAFGHFASSLWPRPGKAAGREKHSAPGAKTNFLTQVLWT